MAHLSLSILEIVLLLFTAVILGITIHFFITSRRSLRSSPLEIDKMQKKLDEWKHKFFNEIEIREREMASLKQQLAEAAEKNESDALELEELQIKNKKLHAELAILHQTFPQGGNTNYLQQLEEAKYSLAEHSEKINQLLQQIDMVKDSKAEIQQLTEENRLLTEETERLKILLNEKSRELDALRQKDQLTSQMSSLLENANTEFSILQAKIQKLEKDMSLSGVGNVELEDMKEANVKLNQDFEEQRQKLHHIMMENQQLRSQLFETEDKLKEANFERQHLQKKLAYFEELNNDLQTLVESNKRLETQLKRMAELESMLHVISRERDELLRRNEDE
jgi:chromosome segregation ATPase